MYMKLPPTADQRFAENEAAHNIINEILTSLIQRINELEKSVQNIPVIDKDSIQYKIKETGEYHNLAETFDILFDKLNRIENAIVIKSD